MPPAMDRAYEGDKATDNSDCACIPARCGRMSRGSHVSGGRQSKTGVTSAARIGGGLSTILRGFPFRKAVGKFLQCLGDFPAEIYCNHSGSGDYRAGRRES